MDLRYVPNAPVALIGLQTDLRDDPNQSNLISTEEAKALSGEGVEDVFKLLTWIAVNGEQRPRFRFGRCIIC